MLQQIARILLLVLVLATLRQAAHLAFRPDPHDDLRRADGVFAAGRYHDALAAYRALVRQEPRSADVFARLGMVHAVRGEGEQASQALGTAVRLRPAPHMLDLVRLYQASVADAARLPGEAAQFLALVGDGSPLAPLRRALQAERMLRAGDTAGAEATFRAALAPGLPPRWRAVVHTRLASLRAADDPQGARDELLLTTKTARSPGLAGPLAALAEPLLPAPQPDAGRLAAALRAPLAERQQILGQLFLAARLYPLAERHFAAVPPGDDGTLDAAAYAAFTRWSAGDRAGGLQQLESLVAAHPAEPRARTLLAMAYLESRAEPAAQAQIEIVRALAPGDPAISLVVAQLHATRRDYVAAAEAYANALRSALPAQRGTYALALARFHLDTTLAACESGLPAAEEATRLLPADDEAWSALAAAHFACRDSAAAAEAARTAMRLAPASPEAAYHLGRALALLGQRDEARSALVAAADLAPASAWRERAEAQIAALGL